MKKCWWAALAVVGMAASAPALASTSGVVISQVYGGGGNAGAPYTNDFVELYNASAAPVSINNWSIQYTSATGTSWGSQKVNLTGSIGAGQYVLIQLGSGGANGVALPAANFSGGFNMSASAGKVALVSSTTSLTAATCPTDATLVDVVGYGGTANCSETSAAPAPSATTALIRNASGCTDTDNNSTDFAVAAPTPRNMASPTGSCGVVAQPVVPSCPSALNVATGAVLDFPLSATDADSIVNAASFVSGHVAGMSLTSFTPAAADAGTASVRLALDGSVAAGSYPVVVDFANNESQSASCTVTLNIAAVSPTFTPIYTIQGSGVTSTMTGAGRTTRGVVTKVNNNGYYLQDAAGDGNPATSDGIFVFTSTAPYVQPGHLLQITGTVTEFNTGAAGNALTAANPVTEFTNLTNTTYVGTGSITPTVIAFPIAAQGDLERVEGMLVQIDTPLTASQNYFQGRYGQVTLSANGRLVKPTNVHRPGTPLALSLADLNARSSLMLDDGTSQQNPNPTPYIGADNTLRAGDTLSGITGVIDYGLATNLTDGLAMYRIHPTVVPAFTRANARTATPPPTGGTLKVASFNVLNYFTTFTDGTNAAGQTGQVCTQGSDTPSASLCRGASSNAEFLRQRAKIVQAMAAIDADVVGLMEIQNNGNTAAQNLVDALNAQMGAGTYAVVPVPPTTGTDAIRVAMIYKPATLALSGSPMSDAAAIHNRPPFAHSFSAGGQKFSVVVNHFKSKGSCPASGVDADQGDGQGCWNSTRRQQAAALLSFIGSVQAAAADNDVMVIGDLNAYAAEDPVNDLLTAGLVNQVPGGYSYVFDGEAGSLDHALATPSLSAQVTGAVHWHINADEPSIIDYNLEFKQPACATCGPDYYSATPYRASDHDPVIVGLSLTSGTAQSISFGTLPDRTIGSGSFSVSAAASSGLTVSFSAVTPATCGVTAGGTVSLLAVGTCTVRAEQPGNGTYAAAPSVDRSFAITATGAAQSITFPPLPDVPVTGGPLTLMGTASSGLAVSYSSLTPLVCTVSGSTLTLGATGTCTVAADQGGNFTFAAAAQVSQSFTVTAAGGGGDGEVPTLPEWAAILMATLLFGVAAKRQAGGR
jgi:predicted extracellular nuclease